jgi:hypothetical protein
VVRVTASAAWTPIYYGSDEFTVPVCWVHHLELHRSGDEAAWWQKLNIDPLPVALRRSTRGPMANSAHRRKV